MGHVLNTPTLNGPCAEYSHLKRAMCVELLRWGGAVWGAGIRQGAGLVATLSHSARQLSFPLPRHIRGVRTVVVCYRGSLKAAPGTGAALLAPVPASRVPTASPISHSTALGDGLTRFTQHCLNCARSEPGHAVARLKVFPPLNGSTSDSAEWARVLLNVVWCDVVVCRLTCFTWSCRQAGGR